ncbi:ANTAR domain-containing protein [Streptomyces sp. NPDC059900]|uniref:ANTAR domain-containing protein n=1 Tax=Streptomyces sp. NPDC059900 TaxID=3155816 RepID=UPI00343DACE4
MTDRALPAQLSTDGEAAPTASPRSPVEGPRLLLPVVSATPRDPDSSATAQGPDSDVEQDPHSRAEQGTDDELVQLRRAMETRPVIDMARGVLMASFGLSADDAWSVLVTVSQNTNTKLHTVAEDLVSATTGGEIPRPFRRQLSATVARIQAPSPATGTDEE